MLKSALTTLLLLAAGVITPALAADPPIDFHATGARVDAAFARGPLSLPSQAAAAQVATGFLAARHAERTIDSLALEREWQWNGLTHVRFGQRVDGLAVYGTYAQGAVNGHGELVHLMENLAAPPAGGLRPARIDAAAALAAALAVHHPAVATPAVANSAGNTTTFVHEDFFWTAPTATRVAIPTASGVLEEGFLVETWARATNLLHHTLVGANGRVLGVQLRTNTDSYNIFPDHPGNSSQTITAGPGPGNAESPVGWLFSGNQRSIEIAGNNARAYLDADNDNAPDAGGVTITDANFVTLANLAQDPSTTDNQAVGVQNLFYLNNLIHDKLYRHGFVEGAGNFQETNFASGGLGSDSVNAEAQDGGGLNNANFATPSDGSNPRMQMYLWDLSTPRRDGDLDSDIPWHEYGHGLTWRMIGNMSGPLSGAVGEGNSDVLSILTNDDVVGEYAYNNPIGIRSEPYDNYSRTYGDFTGSSVHFDGEIYAATLWDLKKRYAADAIPVDTLWDDMVGGMSFTPAGPAFEDMRDGILQQATGSGRECLIWESFAAFGIGVGAKATVKGGGPFGGGSVTITESFDLPPECGGGPGTCTDTGASCSNDADCCSGNCSGGKPSTRVCL